MTTGQIWTLYLLMHKADGGSTSEFRQDADTEALTNPPDTAFKNAVTKHFPTINRAEIGTVNSFGGADLRAALTVPYSGTGPCPSETQGRAIMDQLGKMP